MKIAFGDGIFACNPRDFGIFMPKHLAGQWLLNSYEKEQKNEKREERTKQKMGQDCLSALCGDRHGAASGSGDPGACKCQECE